MCTNAVPSVIGPHLRKASTNPGASESPPVRRPHYHAQAVLHALLLLSAVLVVSALLLVTIAVIMMAQMLLRPPRMTDGKATVLLRRLSPGDLGLHFQTEIFEVRDD